MGAPRPSLVKGGYYHAGQVCVSTQRIFVHEAEKVEFLARFTEAVMALEVGDPLSPTTEVGPLIHPKEADRVMSWIDEAEAVGAAVSTGAERLSETMVGPTILVEPPPSVRVSREEVFGPVKHSANTIKHKGDFKMSVLSNLWNEDKKHDYLLTSAFVAVASLMSSPVAFIKVTEHFSPAAGEVAGGALLGLALCGTAGVTRAAYRGRRRHQTLSR